MPVSKNVATAEFDGTALDMAAGIKRIGEEQKAARATFFTQFTARIFDEFPGLNRVIVQGYTPGFNDGDPCTHSHEVYVGINGFSNLNEGDGALRYIDRDENPDLDWGERYVLKDGADGFLFNTDLTLEEIASVEDAFNAFGEAIEDLYTTDFTLTWVRSKDDGKISFSHDDYECGY